MNKKIINTTILVLTFVASACSTSSGGVEEQERHIHHYIVEEGIQGNCITNGTTNKVYCEECGYVLHDHELLTFPDVHNFVVEKGIEPTCTTEGTTDKVYCSDCGYVSQEHDVIEALGHHVVSVDAKTSGIQYEGNNEYSYCDRCGEFFSNKETYERLKVKNEIWSNTHEDGVIDFKIMIHKAGVKHKTNIVVEYLDQKETYELNNTDTFSYDKMQFDTKYIFSFDTQYEDGDSENKTELTRYINTSETQLPVIKIETKDYEWPSMRRVYAPAGMWGAGQTDNEYVYCSFDLYDDDNNLLYGSSTTPETKYSGARIKSRGNTSSFKEKMPYKIKLGEKVDLLKDLLPNRSAKTYKDKEWLLLSENTIYTPTGFYVNSYISGDNSLNGTFVSLYINGDYRGVYFLSESIKKGGGSGNKQCRIAIDDDGYIIEDDPYWWNEDISFDTTVAKNQTRYTFKYPDSEDVTDEQILYIKNYLIGLEESLLLDDDSYQQYIDTRSFAAWLLTHDILGSYDSGGSNIYLTKKDSSISKLKMGPCWDFDSILSTPINAYYRLRNEPHFYYINLVNHQSFIDEYNSLFNDKKDNLVNDFDSYFGTYDMGSIDSDNHINDVRWSTSTPLANTTISRIDSYISSKIEFINSNI